jgi:alpha-L-fucosidase
MAAMPWLRASTQGKDAPIAEGAQPRHLPSPAQMRWQEAEIGLLFDFILPVVAGDQNLRKVHDPKLYNPKRLDTEQWLDWVPDSGAKYAVFTAHHYSGFMQWQSDAYPYGMKQATWKNGKGDVVADFAESCRKRNIGCGLYYSVHINAYQKVWGFYVDWGKGKGTPAQAAYNRICEQQMEELTSRYGPLIQIWMDSGSITPSEGGADLVPVFEKNQPDSNFYSGSSRADIRWVGNEGGNSGNPNYSTMPVLPGGRVGHREWLKKPEHRKLLHSGDPNGNYWCPAMADIPIRGRRGIHQWYWNPSPKSEAGIYTPDELMNVYYTSVGHNSNMVIGVTADANGVVPDKEIEAMRGFGKELKRRFGKAVAETSGNGNTLELGLHRPQRIDHVVLQEQIAKGERVRDYTVEGLTGGVDTWKELARGQSIGQKWIHRFAPIEVAKIRLRVKSSTAEPQIGRMACFATA